jgi:glucose-6-phosphate 1-dehydrogenase
MTSLTDADRLLGEIEEIANPLVEGLDATRQAPPCVLVVFGASGDLTSRKLMPALARLAHQRQLPAAFTIVGVARTEWSDDDFRKAMTEAVPKGGPEWESLVAKFRYVSGDYSQGETFETLKTVLDEVDAERGTGGNRVFYLATIPSVFGDVVTKLGHYGLNTHQKGGPFTRVVVEKPYGRDLASAKQLDREVHAVLDESQVYRIDHYVGKETVQNVLALRFANAIFEPIWDRRYVDHVQLTVAESIGVGHRGGFYETAGAVRDFLQNHILQVLALALMEPPVSYDANGIRDEKVKALKAVDILRPDEVDANVVRAQYAAGWVEGHQVPGYRQEPQVDPNSRTETYIAMRMKVDNWRWAGVPIFVRTGKRLPKRVTEVAIQYHTVPHLAFDQTQTRNLGPNALVLRIQPDDGITLRFGAKVPGQAFKVRTVSMDFSYGAAFLEETPDAYERLLLDAMVGDPTLFIRTDEVEQSWKIVEPILDAFQDPSFPIARYEAGTWGPPEADRLLSQAGRSWRTP